MTRLRRASATVAALLAAAALGACGGDTDDRESPLNTETPVEGDEVPAPEESERDFEEEE